MFMRLSRVLCRYYTTHSGFRVFAEDPLSYIGIVVKVMIANGQIAVMLVTHAVYLLL